MPGPAYGAMPRYPASYPAGATSVGGQSMSMAGRGGYGQTTGYGYPAGTVGVAGGSLPLGGYYGAGSAAGVSPGGAYAYG